VAGVDEVLGDDAADVAGASDDEGFQRDLPLRTASPISSRVATNGRAIIRSR
jgi:hypothetical protein